MTETSAMMRRGRETALKELRLELEEREKEDGDKQPTEHLLDIAMERLVDHDRLAPYDGDRDVFTTKPLGSDEAMADAFGIRFEGDGEEEAAHVDVFVADSAFPNSVEPVEPGRVKRLFARAQNFIRRMQDGTIVRQMSERHDSRDAADAVYRASAGGLVKGWRIWVVTTGFWMEPGDKSISVPADKIANAVIEVLDLDFFRLDEAGISQRFQGQGLGCIAFERKKSGYSCYLTAVSGNVLAELYHKHGSALVEENVRAYLGDNKVNKQVKNTIRNQPERFLAFNNGLVVSAGGVKRDPMSGGIVGIEQMQIINGGQTTVSIYQSLYNTTRARQEEMRLKLENLWVPMKIVVPDAELDDKEKRALRDEISRAANSQTAVKSSDLAANEPFQIEFARIVQDLRTPEGDYWFYERARGLYNTERRRLKRAWEKEHPASKVFDKTDLSSTWLVWNGRPACCAKGKEVSFKDFCTEFLDQETGMPKDEYGELTSAFAKKLICQHLLLTQLEENCGRKSMPPEMRLRNPRIPVIYAIDLFNRTFDGYVDWDTIWSHQTTPPALLGFLKQMTKRVDAIMREEMGGMMISMWGRKSACAESLRRRFSYAGIELDPGMWGLRLPAGFRLPN